MEIRKSKQSDLDDIIKLYKQARDFMKAHGNPNQWGDHYPEVSIIEEDIARGRSYLCMEEGQAVGTFMFAEGEDETYAKIYQGEWINDEPYAVIHRITASTEKRGAATFCLNWCFNQYQNIRIDTHRDNIPMQNLLKKHGFISCGLIYLKNGDERIAFQKVSR